MYKEIIFGEEATKKIKAGVDKIANAVTTTLGPKGRNVALDYGYGVNVVHDGVTVANEVFLKDKFENMGATLIKQASSKTNDMVGDGTTTSALLAQSIITEGLKNTASGVNPMSLKKDIEEESKKVIEEIKRISKPIKTKEEKKQVATISAQDETIGELIAEAMDKVGDDGIIVVEDSNGLEMELEYKSGMQIESGYVSHYLVNNYERMTSTIEKPLIVVTDISITSHKELVPIVEKANGNKNIVLIAENIDGEALAALTINKVKGNLNPLAIRAPLFGDKRRDLLEDVAISVGATFVSKELGMKLEDIKEEYFGSADSVVSTKDSTTIVGGKGTEKLINERVKIIKGLMENASTFDKEKLKERLSKLSGGVAVIKVGASTESELKEKKLRVEDAVNATKSAVEEGIVAGGGVALFHARNVVDKSLLGGKILFDALDRPLKKIVENAGKDSGEIIAMLKDKKEMGYDVMKEEYVNMIESGIVDPAKVTKSALQNAVSVSLMILTTDCLITTGEEDSK